MNPKHNRIFWLLLVCSVAAGGACGGDDDDDDTGAPVCGDGTINGGEQCDGVLLGSADCASEGFSGGTLACADDCTFDTSGCFNESCGNGAIDEGEDCDGDDLGDATCESAGDFTGGTLACRDDCTFDTSSCVPEDCGNGAIDQDEDCDGDDLGGATCESVGDFGGGTLACSATCSFDLSGCEPLSASDQIAAARAAADGSGLSLPIEGALVTYIKPALGQDPAGIFIQAEQAGPALFVAVAAADLNAALAVGDTVSLTITDKATAAGQPRATAVTGFSIDATGGDVGALVQNVSNEATLVSALDSFDSELITLDGTIVGNFGNAGAPAVAATISTAAITVDPLPRFRLDGALRDTLDLAAGCAFTLRPTPLWRFNTTAQPSAFAASEVIIDSCPAPRVTATSAPAATTVVVDFDRRIDPASVQAGDFTFDDGLTATAAAVDGSNPRRVNVTTATQTPQNPYTLTVAGVTDLLGTSIDAANDTGNFAGFGTAEVACDDNQDNDADGDIDCFDADCAADAACAFGASLRIWEIDADQVLNPDGVEFIEVRNNGGSAVDLAAERWFLLLVNGADDLTYDVIQLGPGTIAAGDVWVVGSATVPGVDQVEFVTDGVQNGADGVLLVSCNACTGPNDFSSDGNDFDPGTGADITSDSGATGQKVDAIAYDTDDVDDTGLWSKLIDVTVQFNENELGTAGTESLQRTSRGNWLPRPPSSGSVR